LEWRLLKVVQSPDPVAPGRVEDVQGLLSTI